MTRPENKNLQNRLFETDIETGLSTTEATARLIEYGRNSIQSAPVIRWYVIFGRQFTDTLVLILALAAIVSLFVGAVVDAITIGSIVVLNGVLGFVQEYRAERAIEALRKMLTVYAHVRRDGHLHRVDATEIVPGDVIVLDEGDRVPADIRLLRISNVQIDESALTGESVPVRKEISKLHGDKPLEDASHIWMGTSVTSGRAVGLAIATGMQTRFGEIAHLAATVGYEATPLQRKLTRFGKQLGFFAGGVALLVVILGLVTNRPPLEMFMTGVSLAVAVVPEGLAAVITVTLALGIKSMIRRKVLLRTLPVAEAIGSATVICTDKTGTLTQNEMTVQKIWTSTGFIDVTGQGYDPAGHFERDGERIEYRNEPVLLDLLETGLICNNADVVLKDDTWHASGDPTEASIVVAAFKAWLHRDHLHVVQENAFTSDRKMMSVVINDGSGLVSHVKGAPDEIIQRCTKIAVGGSIDELSSSLRESAFSSYQQMARQGYRTLAFAKRNLIDRTDLSPESAESDLTLLGIAFLLDPPRPEVPLAIKLAREAGIRIIMITGDAPETALAVANAVGLPATSSVTSSEIESMTDDDLQKLLTGEVVFARTIPAHKLRIVSLLKERGEIVGMTGDGVNDAPALRKADIGIAMGVRGTDVAKAVSDMIIVDDNFASIISGVEEGRRQYSNILRFVRYLLTSNTGEVCAILLNIGMGGPLILLPVQILWMNLVTDGATAIALGVEPANQGIMKMPPIDPKSHVLNKRWALIVLAIGLYLGLGTIFIFQYFVQGGHSLLVAQTAAFTGLVVMEKVNVFNFRSLSLPIHTAGFLTNPWLYVAVIVTMCMQLGAIYIPFLQKALHTVPIGMEEWIVILMVAAPVFVIPEAIKLIRWFRRDKE